MCDGPRPAVASCPQGQGEAPIITFDGEHSSRIGIIESRPVSETPTQDFKTSAAKAGTTAYIAMTGDNQYCAYPVRLNGSLVPLDSIQSYGARTPFFTLGKQWLPTGVIVADGITYARTYEDQWYRVGSLADAALHLQTVLLLAEWIQKREALPTAVSSIKQVDPESVNEWRDIISDFLEWNAHAPGGDRDLATSLDIDDFRYVPDASFAAKMDPNKHQIIISNYFLKRLITGNYLESNAILHHELAHELSISRAGISPFRFLAEAALKRYGENYHCSVHPEDCQMGQLRHNDLVSLKKDQQLDTDPTEEFIAYAVQIVYMTAQPGDNVSDLASFYQMRLARYLSSIRLSGMPVGVLQLSRDYVLQGLHVALDLDTDKSIVMNFMQQYDAEMACALGESNKCTTIPVQTSWGG